MGTMFPEVQPDGRSSGVPLALLRLPEPRALPADLVSTLTEVEHWATCVRPASANWPAFHLVSPP